MTLLWKPGPDGSTVAHGMAALYTIEPWAGGFHLKAFRHTDGYPMSGSADGRHGSLELAKGAAEQLEPQPYEPPDDDF